MLDRDPEALEALLADSLAVLALKPEFVTPTLYERIGRCLKGLEQPGAAAYFAQAAQKTGDQELARTLFTTVVTQTRPALTWQDRERFVLACWFLGWDEDIVQRVPHWHAQDAADEDEDIDIHYPAYAIAQLALALLQQDRAAFAESLAFLAEMIQDDSESSYATTGGVSLWDVYDWALVRQAELDGPAA
jgi:hypothetical protein